MDKKYTFRKEERISAQKEIDLLFNEGRSLISYPLRIVYVEKKPFSGSDVAVLISVPKRKFKRAVKRNRLKRLIRESFRLNKNPLQELIKNKDSGLLIGFIFIGNEMSKYKEIESAMIKALNILTDKAT